MSKTIIHRLEGWMTRTDLPVGKLLENEEEISAFTREETNVQAIYKYWNGRKSGNVVKAADFRPRHEAGIAGRLTLIDVTSDSYLGFRFTFHGGIYFDGMSGKCLADFPVKPLIDPAGIEYLYCKDRALPMAHHIIHNIDGFKRDFLRLLLPLTDRDGAVCTLAAAFCHLSVQGRDELPASIPSGWTTQ